MPTIPKPIENQTLVVSNLENPISFIIASSSSSGTWSPSTIILPQINTYDFVFEYKHLRLQLQVLLTFKPMTQCLCCWFAVFHVDSTDSKFCKFNCTLVCMHNYIEIWSMWGNLDSKKEAQVSRGVDKSNSSLLGAHQTFEIHQILTHKQLKHELTIIVIMLARKLTCAAFSMRFRHHFPMWSTARTMETRSMLVLLNLIKWIFQLFLYWYLNTNCCYGKLV